MCKVLCIQLGGKFAHGGGRLMRDVLRTVGNEQTSQTKQTHTLLHAKVG